jgi:hypothetical protein
VRFAVADLPGAELGREEGGTITLDADAAGHGWFVDPTPADSSEFRRRLADGALAATPGSAAYGRMDLLTAVNHELGHRLGFDHGDGLMGEELEAGTRYPLAEGSTGGSAAPALPLRIDWQAPLGADWSTPLSSYDSLKGKKAAKANFADFAPVKPAAQFDSLGRELLGKGKSKT